MFTRLLTYGLMAACTLHGVFASQELPILDLPYGRWRAAQYDEAADVYTFRNIRYAVPPTGPLRWARPVRPRVREPDIQDGSYGPPCIPGPDAPGFETPWYGEQQKISREDCLFLDAYVPGKVLRNREHEKLPVIVWIYGGGYSIGSKDQTIEEGIYDGTSLVQHAAGNAIVITFNYRLSVFGWLAGTTMENEGLPNAGLHDQRAVFEWVRDYVHLLGGNRDKVSAWGESAGGGSILSHITANQGIVDPLFQRAVVLSPGLSFPIDRKGMVEDQFQNFSSRAGCAGQGLSCLRAANVSQLIQASYKGLGSVGPAPDGRVLKHVFSVDIARGNYWRHLDSLIISHVYNEGGPFVTNYKTLESLSDLLKSLFPTYATKAISTLEDYYHLKNASNESVTTIGSKMVRDAIFTCNIRDIVRKYPKKSYLMQYSPKAATHGQDVVAVWYSPKLWNVSIPLFSGYQSYLLSHAITGNPNSLRDRDIDPPTIPWPKVGDTNAEKLENTLDVVDTGYRLIADDQVLKSTCDVWQRVLLDVTKQGGYLEA
ncbi:carboxylesterase [Nannizzia gypsea CBS 118893]|uniref:Carboxylesterase n=1 Tax=Arthroderma gypseum (strain ATCC MYA-4604 / CBS 118893) TaxID=535722 RepID=E4US74_ARTGP|nr:carboxylesterase [Nannizzia gypsea CBS 118893]EFR00492.1 carboxylesterase [Nannizzia gypsea CBS 118893]